MVASVGPAPGVSSACGGCGMGSVGMRGGTLSEAGSRPSGAAWTSRFSGRALDGSPINRANPGFFWHIPDREYLARQIPRVAVRLR
jgi:hypothetical protein